MSNRRELYAKKLQMYYTAERGEGEHMAAAESGDLWTKYMELKQHLPQDFVAEIHTERKGVIGKLVIVVKRIIRKGTYYIFKQFSEQVYDSQSRIIDLMGETIRFLLDMDQRLEELGQGQIQAKEAEKQLRRWQDDCDVKLSAISRDTIRTKWRLTDYLDKQHDDSEEVIKCGICGYSGIRRDFETKETTCMFDGGELIRYVCPDCGVIFGPTKFSRQTSEQFDDDYVVHYTGHHENDCTYKEKRAFMLLRPTKTGIYLNYGCGKWSRTIQELRDEGYNVYGYEPYAKDIDNPYIISDKEKLSHMRFTGIFSNDILEHLPDPIAELRFMRSLLATPESLMSHCTACYIYKYEQTRFHMFFFTGRSTDIICKEAGLLVVQDVEDEPEDFWCKVFKMQDTVIDILPSMVTNDAAVRDSDGICVKPGGIVFGPYVTLPPDTYHLEICVRLPEGIASQKLSVTAECGKRILTQFDLLQGRNMITLNLTERYEQLEFVVRNQTEECVSLTAIKMQ